MLGCQDRLIVGLLTAEGVLFLSKRFHWFAINENKRWTVLVTEAIAARPGPPLHGTPGPGYHRSLVHSRFAG